MPKVVFYPSSRQQSHFILPPNVFHPINCIMSQFVTVDAELRDYAIAGGIRFH